MPGGRPCACAYRARPGADDGLQVRESESASESPGIRAKDTLLGGFLPCGSLGFQLFRTVQG